MSVSVSRSDGLTILTLTSDQSSVCPPLCQLLGALCYSPGCCSKQSRLSPHRLGAQTVLGALWIITGLLQTGLGVLLITTENIAPWLWWEFSYLPFWISAVFLLIGVGCVLAERFPRPIFVLMSGLLNLAGVGLSITAIVLFSRGVGNARWDRRDCEPYRSSYDYRRHRDRWNGWTTEAPTTAPSDQRALREICEESFQIQWALTASIYAVLIVLSVLNLCIALSSSIISFKTIKQRKSNKPVLEETKATTKEM